MAEELAKALNLSAFPKPYQDLYQVQSKATKDLSDAETSIEKFKLTREADAATQQKKMFDEATDKYQTKAAKEQEKLDSFGDVKFHPTQDNLQDMAGLFSAVGIIGAMIGGSGRNSAMNALSSMTGMLDGWKQGRADLFKQEKIKFDEELNKIKLEKDSIVQKMNAIAKEYTIDKEKADMDYKVLLAQYPNSVLQQMDKIGGLKANLNFINNTLTKATDTMVSKAYDMAKLDKEHQYRLEEAKITAGIKSLKDINPLIQGVRATDNLLTQLQDPEIQKGLLARTKPILEKIKSISDSKNIEFEQAVNSTLTGTDKTTLFLKDALLESYAIERAAKGGQRLTVQDVKMLTPVLDPTNYTGDAYAELLQRRRKTLFNNLQDMGVSAEEITKRSAERPYQPFVPEKSQRPQPTQTDRDLAKTSPELRKKFKEHFGVEP
jgi:hypothetical protein